MKHPVPGLLVCAAVVCGALSACTGIPSQSAPQVVVTRIGGGAQPSAQASTPAPDSPARTIVADFLDASAAPDVTHHTAREFLTADASTRWSDATVTVIDSAFQISTFVNGAVTVTARKIGSLNAAGTYTPDLQGDGGGDVPVPFVFGLKSVNGQWRIDTLPNGLILTSDQFDGLYTQRQLYFYDLAEQHLVPDPRFTQLTDPAALAGWLIQQLVTGQAPELQNAVINEFPQQLDPRRVTFTLGSPSTIDIPGSSQLDAKALNLLAAQIATTLTQVSSIVDMKVVDAGRSITIPQAGGVKFSPADFPGAPAPAVASPSVYYISHAGGIVDEEGRPLPGALGNGTYGLTSAAVAVVGGAPEQRLAGVTGSGDFGRLLVGTVTSGLGKTCARGRLSRPAWAPQRDEVWVGDGTSVLRCGLDGKAAPVPVSLTSGSVTGSVTALRFSPDGSRIALVITASDGSAQVWVGAVVRNQAQVRIDSLQQITPQGVVIKDVAWNDALKLFVIGRVVSSGETNIFEVQVDGSLWTPRNIAGLPQAPDSITVAENQVAWVSAGQTVWVQRAGSWASPGPVNGQTNGTNPVYLE
ncbi:MAG: hypothetical protein M3N95_17605 [Actinomycetota bacterium]|nr:hypothetical protein [Actinomycetota bacterium]